MNFIPALTKKDTRPTMKGNSFSETLNRILSKTAVAVVIEKATSSSIVAPASWRWYEQMLMGFHFGIFLKQYSVTSVIKFKLSSGGNM